nr:hypothetical protein [Tanacetum cinerariifolium]
NKVNDVTRLQALVDRKKVIITEATILEALRLDDAESIDCLTNEDIFTELSRMGLQALVDKKKVIITEATFREALRLDDVESIDCLPNEEIFTELSRMGYKKPSTKLTFYKAFFLPQWNCHLPFHRAQVGDLSSHSTKYSSPDLTQKVFANMRRVGKGFCGPAAVKPSIPSPTLTTQPPPPLQDLPSTSQGRIIANMDADEDVTLKDVTDIVKEVSVDAKIKENADVQGRQVESQAQIYQIDLEHADKVLSMQDDRIEPAELQEVVEVVTTAKLMTKVVTIASANITAATTLITIATITAAPSAARRRKGVDDVIDQIQRKEKEDNTVMRYQALKRKPKTEAQDRKNMMTYLRNMARFKMDYFKGMSYDDIRPIFEKKFNSNVAFLEKTKEQMEEEDNKALKRTSESQVEISTAILELFKLIKEFWQRRLKELKECSWISKGQRLEIIRVLWSAHHNIYNYTYDLAGREKMSINKTCKATTARRIQTRIVFGYILYQYQDQDQDQDKDQAG